MHKLFMGTFIHKAGTACHPTPFFPFLEIGLRVSKADLELVIQHRMTMDFLSSCLHILRTGITGIAPLLVHRCLKSNLGFHPCQGNTAY